MKAQLQAVGGVSFTVQAGKTLADAGERQGRNAERDLLTAELRPITEFCQRAIANRYPFAPNSRADVLPEDFGQLFGQGLRRCAAQGGRAAQRVGGAGVRGVEHGGVWPG